MYRAEDVTRRAVVTGAAGFLGSHLCDRLRREGYAVVGVDNVSTGDPKNLAHLSDDADFEYIEADVSENFQVGGPVDAVFHFASPASPPDYLRLPIETLKVGSLGTMHGLDLARRHGALFFLASTSEIYGDPQVHPQPEDYWGNVNPVGPRAVYDEAKRFSEAVATAYHRLYGLDIRIVRIFNTYGPRMRPDDGRVVSNFVVQALKGDPLTVYGDGRQTRSFCFVDDLIEGIWRLHEDGDASPTNIGNDREFTIRQLADLVLSLTESRSTIVERPLPVDDPLQRCPDLGRARRVLGWEPHITLEAGLEKTIAHFRTLVAVG